MYNIVLEATTTTTSALDMIHRPISYTLFDITNIPTLFDDRFCDNYNQDNQKKHPLPAIFSLEQSLSITKNC